MSNLYQKIYSDLIKHEDKEGVEIAKRYHKYEGYRSYGMATPVLRKVLKRHKEDIQVLNCKNALDLAQKFYSSRIEEQVLAGNYVLQVKIDCLTPVLFGYLDKMLDHFGSWSQIDDVCVEGGKVINTLLMRYPKETLALLRKWNKSKNMWKRRASIVSFTRKVGESGKFTQEALELCENLIFDKEDLVQKGVGWCLKDIMRGEKKKVFEYVKTLRKRGVPATVTLYAIRDVKGAERAEILNTGSEILRNSE